MMIKGGTIEQVGALLDTFAQNDFNCMTTGILKPTLCFHVARQSPASATTKREFFSGAGQQCFNSGVSSLWVLLHLTSKYTPKHHIACVNDTYFHHDAY